MKQVGRVNMNIVRNFKLFEAEVDTGLPLRLALLGLVACSDEQGRFRWHAPQLKLDLLPYDELGFASVLATLEARGFIRRIDVNDRAYGCITPLFAPSRVRKAQPPPPAMRLRVYARDHYRCVYCSDDLHNKRRALCLLPFIPVKEIEESNLVTACKKCRAERLRRSSCYVAL
jgi:hypothetical protein